MVTPAMPGDSQRFDRYGSRRNVLVPTVKDEGVPKFEPYALGL